MSLDVYLKLEGQKIKVSSGIFIRENGQTKEITKEEWDKKFPNREPIIAVDFGKENDNLVYTANITHNLGVMAAEAGIYKFLWRPEEIGINRAFELIEPLKKGLKILKEKPARFKKLNPENGWGNYELLINFVGDYLKACIKYPKSKVSVWR